MNNRRKVFLAVTAVVLILSLAAVAGAQKKVDRAQVRDRIGMDRMFDAGQFVRGLGLTAEQRAEVRTIIQNSRPQILQATKDLIQARIDLALQAAGAANAFGEAQERAVSLRLNIMEQIKAKLTAEQLTRLQERQQKEIERLQRLLDRLNQRSGQ